MEEKISQNNCYSWERKTGKEKTAIRNGEKTKGSTKTGRYKKKRRRGKKEKRIRRTTKEFERWLELAFYKTVNEEDCSYADKGTDKNGKYRL